MTSARKSTCSCSRPRWKDFLSHHLWRNMMMMMMMMVFVFVEHDSSTRRANHICRRLASRKVQPTDPFRTHSSTFPPIGWGSSGGTSAASEANCQVPNMIGTGRYSFPCYEGFPTFCCIPSFCPFLFQKTKKEEKEEGK